MATMPTRIDDQLFEAARVAGVAMSRSAAQQLSHWARLGRELESARGVSQDEIARVLGGQRAYDALADPEQAVVRAAWDERFESALAAIDLAAEFRAAGDTWSEADVDGNVIELPIE